jgi:hypothetical protein
MKKVVVIDGAEEVTPSVYDFDYRVRSNIGNEMV